MNKKNKYTGVCISGEVDSHGDKLQVSGFKQQTNIPVYWDFDRTTQIGVAHLQPEDVVINSEIIVDPKNKQVLEEINSGKVYACVGGVISNDNIQEKDGVRYITDFTITSVGLSHKPSDPGLTALKLKDDE